ncbi:hypothetical protein [Chitinophaga vietnamensis]|uniref:hypothetical protein n=1 Tax=Chitinophaga vietnamensis TaxID=2593957 RepID=UPI0011773AFC|nr:hypothetical protein [Chitinophaga vietnamensis]
MKKLNLLFGKLALLCAVSSGMLVSCQTSVDTPIINCPGMSIMGRIGDTSSRLNLSGATLFRQENDSAFSKYLSIEALSDSMKVIINIIDGPYTDGKIADDSIHTQTYYFSRSRKIQGGLVVAGVRSLGDYNYLTTDSSQVTITRINTKHQTVSGNYTFYANGNITGSGVFDNVCYVSLH